MKKFKKNLKIVFSKGKYLCHVLGLNGVTIKRAKYHALKGKRWHLSRICRFVTFYYEKTWQPVTFSLFWIFCEKQKVTLAKKRFVEFDHFIFLKAFSFRKLPFKQIKSSNSRYWYFEKAVCHVSKKGVFSEIKKLGSLCSHPDKFLFFAQKTLKDIITNACCDTIKKWFFYTVVSKTWKMSCFFTQGKKCTKHDT